MDTFAMLCGDGPFPVILAGAAREKGAKILALGWEGKVDKELADAVSELHLFPFGLIEGMLDIIVREKIKRAMLAGKFDKAWIYQGAIEIDDTGKRLLASLSDHRDDTMLEIVEKVLRERGVEVVDNTSYIKDWLAGAGVMTERAPDEAEMRDVDFGMRMIREIGRLGIGQSVVVKRCNVVAVEAMEHTDETVRRGGALAGEGAVVVKAARPQQDMRWDVPVVGIETLRSLRDAGAAVLAVEAGKTVLIEKEKFIAEADRMGICVIGIEAE